MLDDAILLVKVTLTKKKNQVTPRRAFFRLRKQISPENVFVFAVVSLNPLSLFPPPSLRKNNGALKILS